MYHMFKFKQAFLIFKTIEKNNKMYARIDCFDCFDDVVVLVCVN